MKSYTLYHKSYTLTIGWLYPDLMSTYGDRGNVICLQKRCEWRGIEVKIKEISLETSEKELRQHDLIFMGGAQDRQQKIASDDLRKNKGPVIKEMVENGTPALFVCAAYQFMGHYYRPAQGEDIPGLGIFDLHTVHPGSDKPRCIGNVVVKMSILPDVILGTNEMRTPESDPGQARTTDSGQARMTREIIVGFENHGGRTYLGKKVEPLGEVVVGYGNNGDDKKEGAVYKNAFGTYLHGPVLPKNPHFADLLIKLALEKKYSSVELESLDDSLEWQAHQVIVKRLAVKV